VSDGPALPASFSARFGEVSVRAATEEDFGEVERLLGHLADPLEPGSGRDAFRRTRADPRRMVLLALLDERAVGTLDVLVVDNITHRGSPWMGVENVVVEPAARRRGVGRALVMAAVDLAKGAGCYKVQLLSGEHRAEAHGLYRSLGFDAPVRGFRRYL
jgi:GNAT superfamily N-acetyltransferase